MPSSEYITELVALALKEDVGTGDITAGLISPDCEKRARVITREAGILCGTQFVDGVFRALDPQLEITWHRRDGDPLAADDLLFTVAGNARAILTGSGQLSISCNCCRARHPWPGDMPVKWQAPVPDCWIPAKPFPVSGRHKNTLWPVEAATTTASGCLTHS